VLVTPPGGVYAGTYFGSFSGGTGTWSMIVRNDGSGTYVGYLNSPKSAIVANVQVAADGTFTTTSTSVAPTYAQPDLPGRVRSDAAVAFTLSGSIATSSVSGALGGVSATFSGTADASGGATASVSGLYEATGTASSGTTYVIVGTAGRVAMVTVDKPWSTAASERSAAAALSPSPRRTIRRSAAVLPPPPARFPRPFPLRQVRR